MENRELKITNIADIQALPTVWLWKDKIPKGSLTLFSGPPGVGKTLVLLDIIARLTTGKNFPDGSINAIEKGEVFLLNAEDDKARSVKPRLLAADYSSGSVQLIEGTTIPTEAKKKVRQVILLRDLELIEARVTANDRIRLLVIDPISNYMGDRDMNSPQDVREVLTPVRNLAETTGITAICNSHFNKRGDVTTALQKVGGAGALIEVPRAVWLFGRDREDRELFHMIRGKTNDAKQRTGMKYRIGEREVVDGSITLVEIPFVDWQGEEELDADEQLILKIDAGDAPEKAIEQAVRFIDEYITGERTSDSVKAVAESRGISSATLFRAKKNMPYIEAYQKGREWFWNVDPSKKLPDPFQDDPGNDNDAVDPVAEEVEF